MLRLDKTKFVKPADKVSCAISTSDPPDFWIKASTWTVPAAWWDVCNDFTIIVASEGS